MTPEETYLIWTELRRCAVALEAIHGLLLVCLLCWAAPKVAGWLWRTVKWFWLAR